MDVEGVEPQILSELSKAQKLYFVREMVIEYHHGIATRKLSMSDFLALIEENRFLYRISAAALPLYQQNVTEDINVYAYKAE